MASPPDLNDDAIHEILLRLPPDDPAHLFRAAAVCKAWRRILFDPGFRRRYREVHPTPPFLGFFHNHSRLRRRPFAPTTAPNLRFPFPQQANHGRWQIVDCRHGRVLVEHKCRHYVVWDPITGHREEPLRKPVIPYAIDDSVPAVMCAADGCNHRDCHGGPFKIIFLCSVRDPSLLENELVVQAYVYLSEARGWSTPVSVLTDSLYARFSTTSRVLIGDIYYCKLRCHNGDRIVKLELGSHTLSIIDPPSRYRKGHWLLMPEEDGCLGLASFDRSRLNLWSRTANPGGTAGWIQLGAIDLDNSMLPFGKRMNQVYLIAFADGAGFIFVTFSGDIFVLEKKTGRVREVTCKAMDCYSEIFPFTGFYTPGTAFRG